MSQSSNGQWELSMPIVLHGFGLGRKIDRDSSETDPMTTVFWLPCPRHFGEHFVDHGDRRWTDQHDENSWKNEDH